MSDLVVHTDLRKKFCLIDNQGRRPTCLAFAATATHEYLHQCSKRLCPEWLYYHAVTHAGDPPDAGTGMNSVRHVIRNIGQPEDAHWPYSPLPVDPLNWAPPSRNPSDLLFAESVDGSDKYKDIVQCLENDIPKVIGLIIGRAFLNWSHPSGYAVISNETEKLSNGAAHAVVAVGHGDLNGEPHLLIRNSWGQNWGDGGYAWISGKYIEDRWNGGFQLEEI